jgi:Lrp/AsnC family transcriptional regulator for asnA, asnC and gidA
MDETDRQIVELLRENGRRSNVEIARTLEISEGTVRKRIDRLLAQGAVRIVGVADPAIIGYSTRAFFFLTIELAHVEDVARLLCDMPEVLSVSCTTGEYDLVVEAAFESDRHLMSFLTERVASIPGVVGSKTAHIPRVVKHHYQWALPKPPVPTVLIVDDDPDFVEVMRMVLEAEGYAIHSASNGDDALHQMLCAPPDLVIMDVMMDGVLDGWDASWRIRSNPQLRHTPILVVSSITASDYLSMFPTDDDNLVDNFLSKPVDPKKLVKEVDRLVKRT